MGGVQGKNVASCGKQRPKMNGLTCISSSSVDHNGRFRNDGMNDDDLGHINKCMTHLDISLPDGERHEDTDVDIMISICDYQAEDKAQISVKAGERVRLFGYNTTGDWADVETLPLALMAGCGDKDSIGKPQRHSTVSSASGSQHQVATHQSASPCGTRRQRGWVPASCLSTTSQYMTALYAWYHGNVTRQQGEYLLRSGINGSYLVRTSESQPGQLSITVRYDGRVYHYRIGQDAKGLYYVTETHKFSTVPQLVEHHSKAADGLVCPLLYPAPKPPRQISPSTTNSHVVMSEQSRGLTLGMNGLCLPQSGCQDSNLSGDFSMTADSWEINRTEIVMRHKLGGGQYGDVYEAVWKRYNTIVAVKTVKEDFSMKVQDFREEAAVMKSLRHKNLIQLLGVCTQEPPYYLVTEFMPYGNLLDYLRTQPHDRLPPPILLYLATQIAAGMAYLEAHNFIHRDLATRNCLVGEQHLVKVGDFGLARYMHQADTYKASYGAKFPIKWTAPEGLAYNIFSSKSDVWAFGVVLWEIATYGASPYPGIELQDVYHWLEKGFRMEPPEHCPQQVYEIMTRCWRWEPSERSSFQEIHGELANMCLSPNLDSILSTTCSLSNYGEELHSVLDDAHSLLPPSSNTSSNNALPQGVFGNPSGMVFPTSSSMFSPLCYPPQLVATSCINPNYPIATPLPSTAIPGGSVFDYMQQAVNQQGMFSIPVSVPVSISAFDRSTSGNVKVSSPNLCGTQRSGGSGSLSKVTVTTGVASSGGMGSASGSSSLNASGRRPSSGRPPLAGSRPQESSTAPQSGNSSNVTPTPSSYSQNHAQGQVMHSSAMVSGTPSFPASHAVQLVSHHHRQYSLNSSQPPVLGKSSHHHHHQRGSNSKRVTMTPDVNAPIAGAFMNTPSHDTPDESGMGESIRSNESHTRPLPKTTQTSLASMPSSITCPSPSNTPYPIMMPSPHIATVNAISTPISSVNSPSDTSGGGVRAALRLLPNSEPHDNRSGGGATGVSLQLYPPNTYQLSAATSNTSAQNPFPPCSGDLFMYPLDTNEPVLPPTYPPFLFPYTPPGFLFPPPNGPLPQPPLTTASVVRGAGQHLDESSLGLFPTLPAQDRIDRYLHSLAQQHQHDMEEEDSRFQPIGDDSSSCNPSWGYYESVAPSSTSVPKKPSVQSSEYKRSKPSESTRYSKQKSQSNKREECFRIPTEEFRVPEEDVNTDFDSVPCSTTEHSCEEDADSLASNDISYPLHNLSQPPNPIRKTKCIPAYAVQAEDNCDDVNSYYCATDCVSNNAPPVDSSYMNNK